MENYDNNGYPRYPPPYGYPPSAYPPHPGYLQPSNSFSGHAPSYPSPQHPQLYNHSGPLQYPPSPQSYVYSPSPPHAYAPYYGGHLGPPSYGYPPSGFQHPADATGGSGRFDASANAADFSPHGSGRFEAVPFESSSHHLSHSGSFSTSERPYLSHHSSISSSAGASIYPPIDEALANVHISDRPFPDPHLASVAPPPPPSSYHHQLRPSLSGSFHPYPSHAIPYGGGGSHHGVPPGMQIVPYANGSLKDQASLKVLLLHGSLDIYVFDAKNLPNMDMFSKTIGDMLGPRLSSTLNNKLEHMSSMTSDPYVTVMVSEAVVARTYVVSNSENPVWTQHFNVPVAHHTAEVRFLVKDSDVVGAQLIGTVSLPAERILTGEKVEGIFPIMGDNGKQCKQGAVLRLSIQYTPIERISMYHHGVGTGPNYFGVPGTYFPLRKACKVTLYQDAHVPDDCLPELRLENGMRYEHGKCWHDIFEAISQARRLVYITGWSVFHTVRLVRDGYGQSPTLGELLKSKSQEGVRVLLIIWDDPTSRSILGYQTDGLMGTRDEETRRFFKHSSVQVLLCPRTVGKRHSFMKQQEAEKIYTHHQKQVVVDADAGNNRRKIIAFVGGLDLCGGRYDTPKHPLFRTLQSVHKDDYHNPNFSGTDYSGPREPWHDLHCKIDGPAAYDVLKNFEERWLKAAKRHGIKKLKRSYDDALLKLDRITEIIGQNEILYLDDRDPESWHVQIFRSIDSNSAKGFPKDPREASQKNLVCGKNVLIDSSIHTAYVHAIRAAQHFIYIENQYFLGSSFNWDSHKNLGADNLIPMEIALKIANKIKANERFSAYIVIPMWPEGNPNGMFLQKILYWQNKTMQMMYETIYTALKEVGLDNLYEPQDYLNFFCLGAREASDLDDANWSAANTDQGLAKKNRRFMIYVHSKGMIVDDEYVIIGSANINQRSLEGSRDTEIAMGAYQPQHTWARKLSGPHGQIYGYRMALWAEHIGCLEECFTCPESLECMRRLGDIGLQNWKQYVADEVTEMRGHLIKYPLEVDRKGKVKSMPGHETFPDIGGQITGSFTTFQENLTI